MSSKTCKQASSLVPRPLPYFMSQLWRKIGRRPGTIEWSGDEANKLQLWTLYSAQWVWSMVAKLQYGSSKSSTIEEHNHWYLTAFCAWDSSPHLPVTLARLMKLGSSFSSLFSPPFPFPPSSSSLPPSPHSLSHLAWVHRLYFEFAHHPESLSSSSLSIVCYFEYILSSRCITTQLLFKDSHTLCEHLWNYKANTSSVIW